MEKSQVKTLQTGYWVAITLKENTAPLPCYVGQIEAIDEHGLRITLIDWFIGMATSWDFFAPWESITSALVCTPDHDTTNFGESAGKWQTQMGELRKEKVENET